MEQTTRETERAYVDFEGRWSPFPLDGFRQVHTLPAEINHLDLKQVGGFLQKVYKNDGFYITDYYTYKQKNFVTQEGEELKGEKTEISDSFSLYKGYPISLLILHKYVNMKNREQEQEKERDRELRTVRRTNERTLKDMIANCFRR